MNFQTPNHMVILPRPLALATLAIFCCAANAPGQTFPKKWTPGRTLVAESGHETLGEHFGAPYLVVGFDPEEPSTVENLKLLRQQTQQWRRCGLSLTLAFAGPSKPSNADAWLLRHVPGLQGTICVADLSIRTRLQGQAILFDHRGTLLKHGPIQEVSRSLRSLIPRCLSERKAGVGATARLKKARGLVHHSNRLALAKRLLEQAGPQSEHEEDWQAAMEEIEAAFHSQLRELQFLQDNGRLSEARNFAKALVASVRLDEAWEDIALEHLRAVSARSRLSEYLSSSLLERAWSRTRSRTPKAKDVPRLLSLVKDQPDGAVKARALKLADRVGRALKQ